IMVRGLATGEVDFSRLLKVLSGEVRVGALLSFFFGVLVAGCVYLLTRYSAGAVGPDPLRLGISVGVAMMAGILASTLVGTLVPMGCLRMGIDPAIAAGPFVTVLNDISCTAIYFAVATLILIGGT
ncbi:MAG: magnesium transporter, partial [Planctomycetes bacterium]|nr:magnesium transporter [Planctomycetota bacterium]